MEDAPPGLGVTGLKDELLMTSLLVKHAEISRLLPIFFLPEDEKLFSRYAVLARDGLVESQKKSKWRNSLTLRAFSRTYRHQVNMVEKLDQSFLEIFGGGVAGTHLAAFIEDRVGDKEKASFLRKAVAPETQKGVLMSVQAFLDTVADHCDTILIPGSTVTLLSPGSTHLFVDLVLEVLVFLARRVVSEVALMSTPVEEWAEEDFERVKKGAAGWGEGKGEEGDLQGVDREDMKTKVKESVEQSIFPNVYQQVDQLKGSMGRLDDLDSLISQASTLQRTKNVGREGGHDGKTVFDQVANSVMSSSQRALGPLNSSQGEGLIGEEEKGKLSIKNQSKASSLLEPPGVLSAPNSNAYSLDISTASGSLSSPTSSPRKKSKKKSSFRRRHSRSSSPCPSDPPSAPPLSPECSSPPSSPQIFPSPPLLPSSGPFSSIPPSTPDRASSLLSAPLPSPLFISPRPATPPPSPLPSSSSGNPPPLSPNSNPQPPPLSPLPQPCFSPRLPGSTTPPPGSNTPPPLSPSLRPPSSPRSFRIPPRASPSFSLSTPPSTPPLPSAPPSTPPLPSPLLIKLPAPLKKKEKKEECRTVSPLERVLDELLFTEESYVFGLEELINSYYNPLSRSKALTDAEMTQIFVNSERVLEIHKGILKDLKEHGGSQRIQLICKTLGDNVPLKLAYRVFISGFDLATATIEQLDSSNPQFSDALAECSSKAKKGMWVGKLGLLSLLITPVQRLPRYKLLFSQLIKEMRGADHPDKAEVLATVKKIDRTIIEINHEKRAHQQQMNLGSLMTQIRGNEIAVVASTSAFSSRNSHKFKKVVTRGVVTCGHCDHIIYSSMSMVLQCINCQCYAHDQCEKWFPEACGAVTHRESYLVQPKRKLLHHESVVFTVFSQSPRGDNLVWHETEKVEGLLLIFNDSLLFSEKTGAERYELRFVMKWESNSTISLAEVALVKKKGEEEKEGGEKSELVPSTSTSTARLLIAPPRIKKGIYSFTKCNAEQIHELISEQLQLIRSEKNLTGHLKQDFKISAKAGRFLSFEGWVWLSGGKKKSRFYWCTLFKDRLVLQRSYESKLDKIISLNGGSVCVAAPGQKNKNGKGGGALECLIKELGGGGEEGEGGGGSGGGEQGSPSPQTTQVSRKEKRRSVLMEGVFSLGGEGSGFQEEDGWEFTVYQTTMKDKEHVSLFAPTGNELKYWVHHTSFNISILQEEEKEWEEKKKE